MNTGEPKITFIDGSFRAFSSSVMATHTLLLENSRKRLLTDGVPLAQPQAARVTSLIVAVSVLLHSRHFVQQARIGDLARQVRKLCQESEHLPL
jgi:hypothetical protein